jgi:hypothetical protein
VPRIEVRAHDGDRVWLSVSAAISMSAAAKIATLLAEEDAR